MNAADTTGTMITLISADSPAAQQLGITAPVHAYRVEPTEPARGDLVVCQEIFGVNTHVRRVCDDYAKLGYRVIAPAFFDLIEPDVQMGYSPDDINRGRQIMGQVGLERALQVIGAAVRAFHAGVSDPADSHATEQRAGALVGKPAIIGYCWGGTLAWASACQTDWFGCAVPYYGGGIASMTEQIPRCPVIAHFGRQDHAIPMDGVHRLASLHPSVPVHVYEAGHGFNCDMRGSYDASSAALALQRTLAFMQATIG